MDFTSFKVSGVNEAKQVSLPTSNSGVAELVEGEGSNQTPVEQELAATVESTESNAVSDEKPVVAEEKKIDPKFSILARKEAALHKQREQLKAEKLAIESSARKVAEFESARRFAKENPLKALEALGLTYDSLTEHVINNGKPTVDSEVQAVKQEIDRLKRETAEAQQRAQEAAEQRLEAENKAVIDSFRKNAVNFVLSNSDKYELTIANDQSNLVYEVIEQDFSDKGGGDVMSFEKAAELVEQYLEKRQERIAATKKFQAKYGQKTQTPASVAPPTANTPVAKRPSTLSNAMTASTPTPSPKGRTEQDRIKAALARLDGK